MKTIHLVIPMSGQGNRFQEAGYSKPKPMIPVSGIPMIQRLLRNFPLDWSVSFVLAENHKGQGLIELLKQLRPNANLYFITPHRLGPSFAAEVAIRHIDSQSPVFLSYCDYGMVWDFAQFERFVAQTQCDACLVSYRGFHPHYLRCTQYAFSRMDGERVVEVKEKGNFTDSVEDEFASAGGYYFQTAKLFLDAFNRQQKENLNAKGEYFTSLTMEALLRENSQSHVRVFETPYFFQWGTPQDVEIFEYWEKTMAAHHRQTNLNHVAQVLMPMAGFGSRFQNQSAPKPLIPINGAPMFVQALRSLPKAETTVVVTLDRIQKEVGEHYPRGRVVSLPATPPGQALSTAEGVAALNANEEVIVSSCDHGIVLDPKTWEAFQQTKCDAAIFTIQGYPGTARNPKAFAYVDTDKDGMFPNVKRVSVKQPLSLTPQRDLLLVGTFWFRNVKILKSSIDDLVKKDMRVNGELYLDSVFEILIAQGNVVRSVPLEGYLCWGDPVALAETQYWIEAFGGHRARHDRFSDVKLKVAAY